MADLFQKITDSRNLIEKIGAAIPGFKGYADRNSRRDADKLLRETVATRFEQQWSRISGLQRDLINQGSIEAVDDLEAAAIKLRTFIDRVRTASYGYAGFFDAIKVNETELVKIYQFDASLLDRAVQLSAAVDNVATSMGSDGLPAAIRNVATLAQDAIDAFQGRNELILGSNAPASQ
ncbi:MAG TPA: hypothetical protein VII90_04775 [Anaerolineales bacterium]